MREKRKKMWFGGETLSKNYRLEDLGVNGTIKSK
jgi:hypothetical protein